MGTSPLLVLLLLLLLLEILLLVLLLLLLEILLLVLLLPGESDDAAGSPSATPRPLLQFLPFLSSALRLA